MRQTGGEWIPWMETLGGWKSHERSLYSERNAGNGSAFDSLKDR